MLSRLARRGRGQKGDGGLSLVELMVAMGILGVVTAVAYSVLITVTKQSRDLQGRSETVGQARLAIEQMDRQIRSGNVLFNPANEALPNSMRVYTQANGQERCVQWQMTTAGQLRSRSWSPTWQTDGLVTGWGIVARGLVNTTSPFTLDATSGNAYGSRLINISLQVQDGTAGGPVQNVATSLSGRNTEYGYDQGICSPVPAP